MRKVRDSYVVVVRHAGERLQTWVLTMHRDSRHLRSAAEESEVGVPSCYSEGTFAFPSIRASSILTPSQRSLQDPAHRRKTILYPFHRSVLTLRLAVRLDDPLLPQPPRCRHARRRRHAQSRSDAQVSQKDRTLGTVSLFALCFISKERLTRVRHAGRIETRVGLWRKGTESEGWLEGADWVVDAIDNINTKVGPFSWSLRSGRMLIRGR